MARQTVRQQIRSHINRIRKLAVTNGHKMSAPLFIEVADAERDNLFPMWCVSRCVACGNTASVRVIGRKPIEGFTVDPIQPTACKVTWYIDPV